LIADQRFAALGFLRIRPQEDVFPAFDENTGFRLEAWRHKVDADKRKPADDDERHDDPGAAPPHGLAERAKIDVEIDAARRG